jgi:hypothetical protein
MSSASKFDYGDCVLVRDGKHKDRTCCVVGMSDLGSRRTYAVEFGDGSDTEIEEELLSKADE